ncbi:MAG: PEP-CTERM sorting domain-containing protein, partial [bacterium]|nr:PEP-CTERM sorting domain-containing protein [bacterium]
MVPEPGSGGLLLLGLFGAFISWRLARRKGPGAKKFWMPLLLLSLLLGVQGLDISELIAQSRACLLSIERDGSGSGRVVGDGIDCGEECGLSSDSGEVLHVKAIAGENSRFSGWQVNGDPYQGLFRMSGDTLLTALFEEQQPPQAVNDRYSSDEDVELQLPAPGILANDSDPDGDTLNAELVQAPLHGTLTLNADGSFTYTPHSDVHGIDQFLYRVNDGALDSAIAAVTIDIKSL